MWIHWKVEQHSHTHVASNNVPPPENSPLQDVYKLYIPKWITLHARHTLLDICTHVYCGSITSPAVQNSTVRIHDSAIYIDVGLMQLKCESYSVQM